MYLYTYIYIFIFILYLYIYIFVFIHTQVSIWWLSELGTPTTAGGALHLIEPWRPYRHEDGDPSWEVEKNGVLYIFKCKGW